MSHGDSTVVVAELYPDLLGTYGDTGNVAVLTRRLEWRGYECRVVRVTADVPVPSSCDIYVLGGGEDGAQQLACERLGRNRALSRAVQRGAAVLAVCAGMQILGRTFSDRRGDMVSGIGLLDLVTAAGRTRAVGEVVVEPDPALLGSPVIGFENHQGRTTLGAAAKPLGSVRRGVGNGGGVDGAVQGHVVGTYLHGPVLARNPDLADLVLSWALDTPMPALPLIAVERLRQVRLTGRRHRGPFAVEPPIGLEQAPECGECRAAGSARESPQPPGVGAPGRE